MMICVLDPVGGLTVTPNIVASVFLAEFSASAAVILRYGVRARDPSCI
jgi:hypothetical protein